MPIWQYWSQLRHGANALPRVISELRARGYSFVTLDALTR
jgi:peptidoglycan/xylan/chitin deacetylase (PgdA/CDA1 family)